VDIPARYAARRKLERQLAAGEIDHEAVYVVDSRFLSQFQRSFGDQVSCRVADGFDVCTPR
jgi:hypothetical protein